MGICNSLKTQVNLEKGLKKEVHVRSPLKSRTVVPSKIETNQFTKRKENKSKTVNPEPEKKFKIPDEIQNHFVEHIDPKSIYSEWELQEKNTCSRIFVAKSNLTGTNVMIKEFRDHDSYEFILELNNIYFLLKFDHPKIIRLFNFYLFKNKFFIVTEHTQEGNLMDIIKKKSCFSEPVICSIIYQLLDSLFYLHENKKVIHRNIKPENILIKEYSENEYILKISDFRRSIKIKNLKVKEIVGTNYYIAPEVIDENYNEKSDLWSIGIILYLMLDGNHPFKGKNQSDLFGNIKTQTIDITNNINRYSSECLEVLKFLLEKDPRHRLSAKELVKHHWFEKWNIKAKYVAEKSVSLIRLNYYNPKLISIENHIKRFLVENSENSKDLRELSNIFRLIDSEKNWKLSRETLINFYKKSKIDFKNNLKNFELHLDVIFNGNEFLTYTDFLVGFIDENFLFSNQNLNLMYNYLRLTNKNLNSQIFSEKYTYNSAIKELKLQKNLCDIIKESNESNESNKRQEFIKTLKLISKL